MNSCPQCRSADLVGFTLAPAGQALHFSHCRACEHRWWNSAEEGHSIRLDDALQRIGGRAA